jgi:phenylacetate-CoA ligase
MGSLASQIVGLHEAATRPWWEPDRLARLQTERLRRLVDHAWANVSGYRDRMQQSRFRLGEIGTSAELARLPLLTRRELIELADIEEEGVSGRRAGHVTMHTSGSSGVPLALRYRRRDATELNATWLRPLLAHGIRPRHTRLEITGPHNFPVGRHMYERLGFWRRHCVSVFEEPSAWLAAARAARADYLWGYSGSLKLFAEYLLDTGQEAPAFRAVFGVSDLVDPACRSLVREAFGRPLVDVYGAAEGGCIAWECPTCDGYHVNIDTVIVEILDGNRAAPPGVAGRVVITNLLSFAMPIVRYELGDVAAMSPRSPACGRGLPLMEVVEGRANAFVRLPSGRMLSPMFFFGLMKPVEHDLRAWRVIQESVDRLTVLVVAGGRGFDSTRLVETIRRLTGEAIDVSVVNVEALPREPSGKVRAVVSHLAGMVAR